MRQKESYNFTIDLKNLIKICMQDPSTKKMVFDALREDSASELSVPCTTPLGAANMKTEADAPDDWYTSFVGTSTKIGPGQDGFVLRNLSGTGPRISIKLSRQEGKKHLAQTENQSLPVSNPSQLSLALKANREVVSAVAELQPRTLTIDL